MANSVAYNMDCLEYMRTLPDNYFDLCVADPPYGSGLTETGGCQCWFSKYHQDGCSQTVNAERERERERYNRFGSPGSRFEKYKRPSAESTTTGSDADRRDVGGEVRKKIIAWDVAPGKEHFDELFRVSRNQIIWGGNYFALPPTRCFLIWRKLSISESFSMAMAEYAWTSFNSNAKVYEAAPQGTAAEPRFHPCLPKGTEVRFNGLWKNVEDVALGEKNEFGKVVGISTHVAQKMVEVGAGGERVTATWNHPFLARRGDALYWIDAEQLKEGDKLLRILRADINLQEKGICGIGQMANGSGWNIVLFGKNIMGRFRLVCKFITLMATKQITIFPISNLSRPLNTNGCTKVADLKTGYGTSLVNVVGSIKQRQKRTGTFREGGLMGVFASLVTSRKSSRNVACELLTVGSVKITNQNTTVYNLTLDNVPAFETRCGITHNTQKPVSLYAWIYKLYAKEGDRIFDPYLGSGSSRIAAYDAGLDFTGCEIDEIYFQKQEERFAAHTAQISLFD